MFENFVLPKLKEKAGEIVVRRKILRVSGLGESAVDEAIAPIYKEYETVETSILFNKSEIEIHLIAKSESENKALEILHELADKIVEKLGVAVFAMNGEQMEEIVGKLLTERAQTVSFAESCTGGLVSQRLTEVAGSSKYFTESVIAYANEAKVKHLSVPREIIEKFGAVSAEVAEAMASGMRTRAATDYAVSITGIAGPDGGTEEKPVGTVFIGYADETRVKSLKIVLPGDRYLIRWRASQAALDYLRRKILQV
jgi:nicotinamide-nucleotide amidase